MFKYTTALPGLDAKPIIDMMGIIAPQRVAEFVDLLEQRDYESLGEVSVPGW